MRWSIRMQLLAPTLLIVIGAILGASVLSACLAADWARRRQEENLTRVVATLSDASFPLTELVLKKMSGLSGAEFVVLAANGKPESSSQSLANSDFALLRQLPLQPKLPDFATSQMLDLAGGRYLASRLPVASLAESGTPLTLVVLYPEQRWSVAQRQVIYPPLVVGAAAVLLVGLVTTLLARRVVRPLASLQRQMAAIEQGDFSPMPLDRRNDELQDVRRAINHMVERLARYDADVRQNERLRTLGQLGAGIAHQVRNAATGARLALDLHRQECPLEAADETLDVASRQFELIETYLQRFMTLGRGEKQRREPLELDALIDEVLPLLLPACRHARIDLQFERPPAPVMIAGDSNALSHLLINLITNAVEAAAGTPAPQTSGLIGAVRVAIERDPIDRAVCIVSDTGPGPSGAIGERLFEPFVTDKPDGTGLGLTVVRQIAAEHGAELSWKRDGGTTRFVVAFPDRTSSRTDLAEASKM